MKGNNGDDIQKCLWVTEGLNTSVTARRLLSLGTTRGGPSGQMLLDYEVYESPNPTKMRSNDFQTATDRLKRHSKMSWHAKETGSTYT